MLDRKYLERVKTVLIVVLTISALVLLYFAFAQQSAVLLRSGPASETESAAYSDGPLPVAVVFTDETAARYSAVYDASAVSAAMEEASPLLAAALSSAGRPVSSDAAAWRSALSGRSIFVDYAADVPLSALAGWLGGTCDLDNSARWLVLACEDSGTALYLSDGSHVLRCSTDVRAAELAGRLEGFAPNGARFTFELDEPGLLTDYGVLPADAPVLETVRVKNPFRSGLDPENMLSAFGMNRFVANSYPEADGALVYIDGSCSLRIGTDGLVQFQQTGKSVLSVSDMTQAGVIAASRQLLTICTQSLGGQASLRFSGLTESVSGRSFAVYFDYVLDGVLIYHPDGAAAEITVTDGFITAARIQFCEYEQAGYSETPLPPAQAAAVVSVTGGTPLLVYEHDEDHVSACWVAS